MNHILLCGGYVRRSLFEKGQLHGRFVMHLPNVKKHSVGCGPCIHAVSRVKATSNEVAESTGLEPATSAVTGRRSNQLS